jgi:hypothetical protein
MPPRHLISNACRALLGAYDEAHWQTAVLEIKLGIGVLKRGTILATGSGADIAKLVLLSATTEAQAYGVLLDPSIDTADPYSDGSVTGPIAKAGSFKGSALIVPAGVDAGLIAVALRGRGSLLKGRSPFPPRRYSQRRNPFKRQRRRASREASPQCHHQRALHPGR